MTKIDVTFTDIGDNFRLTLRDGVLIYIKQDAADDAQVTLTLTKSRLIQLAGGDTTSPGIDLAGDAGVLQSLLGVLDRGDPSFGIVIP